VSGSLLAAAAVASGQQSWSSVTSGSRMQGWHVVTYLMAFTFLMHIPAFNYYKY